MDTTRKFTVPYTTYRTDIYLLRKKAFLKYDPHDIQKVTMKKHVVFEHVRCQVVRQDWAVVENNL